MQRGNSRGSASTLKTQNSLQRRDASVPVADSKPTTPRKVSHAAWFSAGSELTRSRIICQATMLRAPSGGGPIAKETEHCGQKQIHCAADFCRGLTLRSARTYTRQPICVPLRAPDYNADNAGFPKVCSSQRGPAKKKYCLHAPGASRKKDSHR